MKTEYLIIYILFAHFVADFICQTHWQASNKSENFEALCNHITSYTCVIGLFIFCLMPFTNFTALDICSYTIINGWMHLFTDYITSRINKKLWESGNVHNFFVGIGVDQFIHATTLVLTIKLFNY